MQEAIICTNDLLPLLLWQGHPLPHRAPNVCLKNLLDNNNALIHSPQGLCAIWWFWTPWISVSTGGKSCIPPPQWKLKSSIQENQFSFPSPKGNVSHHTTKQWALRKIRMVFLFIMKSSCCINHPKGYSPWRMRILDPNDMLFLSIVNASVNLSETNEVVILQTAQHELQYWSCKSCHQSGFRKITTTVESLMPFLNRHCVPILEVLTSLSNQMIDQTVTWNKYMPPDTIASSGVQN